MEHNNMSKNIWVDCWLLTIFRFQYIFKYSFPLGLFLWYWYIQQCGVGTYDAFILYLLLSLFANKSLIQKISWSSFIGAAKNIIPTKISVEQDTITLFLLRHNIPIQCHIVSTFLANELVIRKKGSSRTCETAKKKVANNVISFDTLTYPLFNVYKFLIRLVACVPWSRHPTQTII